MKYKNPSKLRTSNMHLTKHLMTKMKVNSMDGSKADGSYHLENVL
jgi:hypothetical protein